MKYGTDGQGEDFVTIRRLGELCHCRALLHLQRMLRRPHCFQLDARRRAVDIYLIFELIVTVLPAFMAFCLTALPG